MSASPLPVVTLHSVPPVEMQSNGAGSCVSPPAGGGAAVAADGSAAHAAMHKAAARAVMRGRVIGPEASLAQVPGSCGGIGQIPDALSGGVHAGRGVKAELLDGLLAQLVLLNLACDRDRELVDEQDVARHLVM